MDEVEDTMQTGQAEPAQVVTISLGKKQTIFFKKQ